MYTRKCKLPHQVHTTKNQTCERVNVDGLVGGVKGKPDGLQKRKDAKRLDEDSGACGLQRRPNADDRQERGIQEHEQVMKACAKRRKLLWPADEPNEGGTTPPLAYPLTVIPACDDLQCRVLGSRILDGAVSAASRVRRVGRSTQKRQKIAARFARTWPRRF